MAKKFTAKATQTSSSQKNPKPPAGIQFAPTEIVLRSKIKPAKYNPRVIDKSNQDGLRASLKEYGVVEDLIWNKRTGNLVGGHQRLNEIDKDRKYDTTKKDYELPVKVVDLDLKREKALNFVLNNPAVRGRYDIEKADEILRDLGKEDLGLAGFHGISSVENLYLDSGIPLPEWLGGQTEEEIDAADDAQAELEDFADEAADAKNEEKDRKALGGEKDGGRSDEEIQQLKDKKKRFQEKQGFATETETHVTLIFPTNDSAREFLEAIEEDPTGEWADGKRLADRFGIELPSLDELAAREKPRSGKKREKTGNSGK